MQTSLVLAALCAVAFGYSTTMSMNNLQNGNCRIMNGMLYDGSSTRQLTSSEMSQVQNYMNMMGGSNMGYGSSGYNSGYGSTGYNTGYGSSGYNMGYGSSGSNGMYGQTGYGSSGYSGSQYNPSSYTGSTANGYNTNGYYNPSGSSSYNNGMMYDSYGNSMMGSGMANMPCLCRYATCASRS